MDNIVYSNVSLLRGTSTVTVLYLISWIITKTKELHFVNSSVNYGQKRQTPKMDFVWPTALTPEGNNSLVLMLLNFYCNLENDFFLSIKMFILGCDPIILCIQCTNTLVLMHVGSPNISWEWIDLLIDRQDRFDPFCNEDPMSSRPRANCIIS